MSSEIGTAMVTAIIPCWNSEASVERAIRSVADDPAVLEVIVVDNGSSDRTREITRSIGGKVVLLDCVKRGASCARNWGLARANSEFVLFLDADDYVEDGYVSELAASAVPGVDVVIAGHRQLSCTGQQLRQVSYRRGMSAVDVLDAYLVDAVQTGGFLWRRTWLGEAWDETLPIYQDGELAIRMLLREPRIAIIENPQRFAIWQDSFRPNRITNSFSSEKAEASLRALQRHEAAMLALKDPRLKGGLALRFYGLARRCYNARQDSCGDLALARARALGMVGHPGGHLHSLVCSLIGLKRKIRLIETVRHSGSISEISQKYYGWQLRRSSARLSKISRGKTVVQ